MSSAEIDSIPLLMGVLWSGFSLAYIPFLWIQRVSTVGYLGRSLVQLFGPVSPLSRLVFTLLGLVGALGSAGLVGFLRSHVSYSDTAFLLGMAIGGVMGILTWKPWRGTAKGAE